ncbi:DUF429 domain-containing protein [Dyadobacter sp. CY326]|uniref:DUF429 domain-containing protein n=1 Tax=Dyadobacter sp. CY326 TaxID=2907300 RepID=UPI001F466ED8|nr:DUF429 domain-containing protein [Dyadobacter sp. CY326]MCE7067068.1 DUF429 domain-containing protein [Dyadobacter sp. CY326]
MYLGLDGCRSGWLVATIDGEKRLSHSLIPSLNELPRVPVQLALIDIPLECADHIYRPCEISARAILGPKKSASVFLTPHRSAVYANDYAEANRLNKLHLGKGLSIQTWNICNKIKEAINFVAVHPSYPLFEAHPELCFHFLNQGQPLLSKKASPEGAADRLKIIAAHDKDYPNVIAETMRITKRKDLKLDDILDATILAIRASAEDLRATPAHKRVGDRAAILY